MSFFDRSTSRTNISDEQTRHEGTQPRKSSNRKAAAIMAAAAVFATGFIATPAHADASTTFPGVTINKTQDGQPPFDLTAGPGSDTSATNNEVRAGDLVKYTLTFSLNDANAAQQTPFIGLGFVLRSFRRREDGV